MKERIQRFAAGRYGFDDLSKIYLGAAIGLMILSLFSEKRTFYVLSLLCLAYCYYRAFSRNIAKRQKENQKYHEVKYRFRVKWNAFQKRREQRAVYRFYKCPQCGQRVRVPKGKGRICITCPKCRTEFIKKS